MIKEVDLKTKKFIQKFSMFDNIEKSNNEIMAFLENNEDLIKALKIINTHIKLTEKQEIALKSRIYWCNVNQKDFNKTDLYKTLILGEYNEDKIKEAWLSLKEDNVYGFTEQIINEEIGIFFYVPKKKGEKENLIEEAARLILK